MGKDADAFYEFMTAPTTKVSVVSRKKTSLSKGNNSDNFKFPLNIAHTFL